MLEYEAKSCIDVSNEVLTGLFNRFERSFGVEFPADFVSHSTMFHGGVPARKCVATDKGRECVVGRFLNVLREEDLPLPSIPSWRATNRDVRLDYSLWYLNELWPENAWLPFAAVDTDGRDCRECHDYFFVLAFTESGEVVFANGIGAVQWIAEDFTSFCKALYVGANPITQRNIGLF